MGFANKRPANRDALALSSAQFAWLLTKKVADFQHRGGLTDPVIDFRGSQFFQPEIQREIFIARHVRVKRIGLEYHRNVALPRRDRFNGCAAQANPAGGGGVQAGNQAQQCGLSAT